MNHQTSLELVRDQVPLDVRRLRWGGLELPAVAYIAGLAPGSRATQAVALRHAARVWGFVGADGLGRPELVPWPELTRTHVLAVRSWAAATLAPSTANRILTAVRGVLREAYRARLLSRDLLDALTDLEPVSGVSVPPGRSVDQAELGRLFASCMADTSELRGRRDAVILAFLYGAGLRRGELVGIELCDVRPDGSVLVRHGKGRRERLVQLPAGAERALGLWLFARGAEPGPLVCALVGGGDRGPVRAASDRPVAPQVVWARLRARGRAAGVASFTPHDLRRSFIGDSLDAGTDIVTVQQAVGHSSPTTTARYDRRAIRAQRDAAARLTVPV